MASNTANKNNSLYMIRDLNAQLTAQGLELSKIKLFPLLETTIARPVLASLEQEGLLKEFNRNQTENQKLLSLNQQSETDLSLS